MDTWIEEILIGEEDVRLIGTVAGKGVEIKLDLLGAAAIAALDWTRDNFSADRILAEATNLSASRASEIRAAAVSILPENLRCFDHSDAGVPSAKVRLGMMLDALMGTHSAKPHIDEVTWIVTNHCHLNCAYCYVQTQLARRAADSVLSLARVCDILAQCYAIGAKRIMLRGGEPFMRADLPKIIVFASSLGLRVDVITKAALSNGRLRVLVQAHRLSLGFSLDTVDATIGDELTRKQGQTLRLMRSINRAVALGLDVTIEATVTSQTIDDLEHLIAFARMAGVTKLHLREVANHSVRPVGPLLLSDSERRQLVELAVTHTTTPDLRVIHTPAFKAVPHCGEGISSLTFLPDGRVTKCTASLATDPRMIYSNLNRESVAEALSSTKLAALLNQVRRTAILLPKGVLPVAAVTPCSQLVALRYGDPFPGHRVVNGGSA